MERIHSAGEDMLERRAKHISAAVLALVVLTGASGAGCSNGQPGHAGKRDGDDFDQDDIQVTVVRCASKDRPYATVRVTVDTSPKDRQYFVGLEFLDSEGKAVDSSSLKLTAPSGAADKDEFSEKVKFPMHEPGRADEVTSCKMDHAF